MNTPAQLLPEIIRCQVRAVEALTADIHRVRLCPEQPVRFLAGQYLELLMPDGRAVPFSIASAPHMPELELNIMHVPDSAGSNAVMAHLSATDTVEVRLPKGDCVLNAEQVAPGAPLVFIAASTGFAQIKSMVEHALEAGLENPLAVFWGVRSPENLYDLAQAERWQQRHPQLRFVPVVSEDAAGAGWSGATGLVHEQALAELADLSRAQVYVSGSPAMVYAVEDAFRARGMGDGQMFSDVYSYAPRS